jgi:hypothetical protein
LFDSQLEYVVRELLDELALHPVPIGVQALDKGVYSGGGLVIERIHELARGYPPVWQLHILNRELAAHEAPRIIALLR